MSKKKDKKGDKKKEKTGDEPMPKPEKTEWTIERPLSSPSGRKLTQAEYAEQFNSSRNQMRDLVLELAEAKSHSQRLKLSLEMVQVSAAISQLEASMNRDYPMN